MPIVSVVIPTTRRHDLVQRALRSVFAQTVRDIEVIVVIDGPNPETVAVLGRLDDPRLRILQNERSLGAGGARNRAAAEAKGDWIAFLDDDDEWLPEKLEKQLAMASVGDCVLVSCRSRIQTPKGAYVWPRTLYDSAMPVDEYLFDRRTFFRGDGYIQTSSFMVPAKVFAQSRFGDTRQQEDTTLLLRITKQLGGKIVMCPDTLVVLYRDEQRETLGSDFVWPDMLKWIDSMGPMITRRAYAGFCLIYLGSRAAEQRDYAGFRFLLTRAFRKGSPTPMQLLPFLSFWLLPAHFRRQVRAWLGGGKKRARLAVSGAPDRAA
jgi:glycosyltransferase involved in cell wall biosynthesis